MEYLIKIKEGHMEKMPETLDDAMKVIGLLQKNIRELESELGAQSHKVAFFDSVAESKYAISIRDLAKVLSFNNMSRKQLFDFLKQEKVLTEDNTPYQKYIDAGYFRVIEQHYIKRCEKVVTTKTLVYQKGVDFVRKLVTSNNKES